ncbi:MAG: hypothetical protein HC882_01905 [Acidobacteria bacterium]|nr:hypothetical protein [Acidobacteriota bacterium]
MSIDSAIVELAMNDDDEGHVRIAAVEILQVSAEDVRDVITRDGRLFRKRAAQDDRQDELDAQWAAEDAEDAEAEERS